MRRQLEDVLGRAAMAALPGVPGSAGARDRPVPVTPDSTQQVADLLGLCHREGWRVWPAGRSSRRRPSAHFDADVVLSTARLAGLTIYEPEDLTVGCRAGTSHGQLSDETRPNRQMLPLEPAAAPGASLGGTLALADAGPLRAGYGAVRDLVLGVTAVTSDGRVLTFGGRVVKNVAGYDLVRLLVGSRGTLAVITELHARLRAMPEADATILLEVRDALAAATLALQIRDTAAPVALELISPAAAGRPWQLAARLHGSALGVADATNAVSALGAGAAPLAPEAAREWWTGLASLERNAPLRLRLVVLPDRLGMALAACDRFLKFASGSNMSVSAAEAGRPAGAGFCAAHVCAGLVRLGVHPPATDRTAGWVAALAELGSEIVSIGGTWTYDCGGDIVRAIANAPQPPPRSAALLRLERGLKQRFDPGELLPPLAT